MESDRSRTQPFSECDDLGSGRRRWPRQRAATRLPSRCSPLSTGRFGILALVAAAPLATAQEDRDLERISIALENTIFDQLLQLVPRSGAELAGLAPEARRRLIERVRGLAAALPEDRQVYIEFLLVQQLQSHGLTEEMESLVLDWRRHHADQEYGRMYWGEILVQVHRDRGRLKQAYAELDWLTGLCEQGRLTDRAGLHGLRGELHYENGLLDEALRELEAEWELASQAAEVALTSDDEEAIAESDRVRYHALLRQADFGLATGQPQRAAKRARELAETTSEPGVVAIADALIGLARYLEAHASSLDNEAALRDARGLLSRALASPQLPDVWRTLLRVKLFKVALEAGDFEEAVRQRDASEAGCGPEHPKYAVWVSLAAWLAREQGADVPDLRRHERRLIATLDEMLESWRAIADREGGVGFLHLRERRMPLEELIEITLALAPGSSGVSAALDHVLRVQAQNNIALVRKAPAIATTDLLAYRKPGEGIAVYVPGARSTFLFLIDDQGLACERLAPLDVINADCQRFARWLSVHPESAAESGEAGPRLQRLSAVVRDSLLPKPVLDRVLAWKSGIFVGCEETHRVPPAALVLPGEKPRLLGEVLPITEIASLPLLIKLSSDHQPRGGGGRKLALVACVDTRAEAARQKALQVGPMPSRLVEALVAPYSGGHVEVLVDEAATWAAAVRALASGADVTQLVGHRVRDLSIELGDGIALRDTVLTNHDLDALELRGLIVLSACEAGRTAARSGDSPLSTGLAGAFLRHGAVAVVQSQATVELASHVELMAAFHAALAAGNSPAKALQLARQRLAGADLVTRFYRAQVQAHGFAHRPLW